MKELEDIVAWRPSPNYSSRVGFRPKAIVWHTMVGTMEGTAKWFEVDKQTKDKEPGNVSAHFGVSKDGEIHQYVSVDLAAWHCGNIHKPKWGGLIKGVNPNLYTFGVEFEGDGDKEQITDIQLVQGAKLWVALSTRFGPLESVLHRSINHRKSCPGVTFPLALLESCCRVIKGSNYFAPEQFLNQIK